MGEATNFAGRTTLEQEHFNPRFPWGKRLKQALPTAHHLHFNPRFPWGKRPADWIAFHISEKFQSTLPVGEATTLTISAESYCRRFQSTLPVGEATLTILGLALGVNISIHASRGGSDTDFILILLIGNISIHASRGGSDPHTA